MSTLDLYVKKRRRFGMQLWWICNKLMDEHHPQGPKATYVPYTDVHAPTGYGYTSRAKAERRARELERMFVTQEKGQEAQA